MLVRRLELGQPVAVVAVARPLVAAGGGGGRVAVWRARDGALLHRLETRGAAISRLALGGDRLLAGDVRGNLLLWDRRPGGESEGDATMASVAVLGDAVRGLDTHPRGITTVSYCGQVILWDFWE